MSPYFVDDLLAESVLCVCIFALNTIDLNFLIAFQMGLVSKLQNIKCS